MKKIALLLLMVSIAVLDSSCDKCRNIDCFTPPNEFRFQLLDKDSGEDLVANGTFSADEISVFSIADNEKHDLEFSTDGIDYIFSDFEIGWKTGTDNTNYELRLNAETVLPFTYESREKNGDCCTFFEFVQFEIVGAERLFISQSNMFQLRL